MTKILIGVCCEIHHDEIMCRIVVGRGSFNWHGAFGGYLGKVDCFMESDLVCVGNGTEDLFWSRILFGLDDEVHHATSLWIQRIFTYRLLVFF